MPMTDKSNFTPDEWKLLLESVTMAGIAITAAEPSGLWGVLKESFAGGTMLAQAKMDPNANPLIKAVIAEFDTAQGRSAARDGLKEKLAGSKPADIKAKSIETVRQAGPGGGRQGTGRRRRLQRLAVPDQPARGRGRQGGRVSRHRRCGGERQREGNAHGDFQRPQAGGVTDSACSRRGHRRCKA